MAEQALEALTAARAVHELDYADEAVLHAARWQGSLVLSRTAEIIPNAETTEDATTFLDSLNAAREGSIEARLMVGTNIDKAVCEGLFKDGHITSPVELWRGANGNLRQHGQSTKSVHRNAILYRPKRHPTLEAITEVEVTNDFLIGSALDAGDLIDNYFVAISLVPAGVPEKDLGHKGDGYFLDSLTFAVQATTEKAENATVTTETAFIAGVEATPDDNFADKQAKRFDLKAMQKLYARFGQKPPQSAVELLDNPLLISKSVMPNGLVDLMPTIYESIDEVLDRSVERTAEDFQVILDESRKREASMSGVREKILEHMIEVSPYLDEPIQAVNLLWKLVREYSVEAAVGNLYIDPKVFGPEAAPHIRQARAYSAVGNTYESDLSVNKALEHAIITGCGGGSGGSSGSKKETSGGEAEDLESIAGSDSKGSLAFRCPNGHLNIRPREETIDACQHKGCKAQVAC